MTPGLSASEFERLEDEFGVRFAPDHRLLLSIAVPVDDAGKWLNWRSREVDHIQERLAWPTDGLLFDVEHNALWHPDWGERPAGTVDAIETAQAFIEAAPPLAPIYAHRMLPTDPHEAGNPVLSVWQADIIYYGIDLLDWFEREFHRTTKDWDMPRIERRLPFWSWFLEADG